jgi:hypothetical protein
MLLNQFAKEVYENAVAHGWYDPEPQFPACIALMHSELSEALEEFRRYKPAVYFDCKIDETDEDCICDPDEPGCGLKNYQECEHRAEKPEGVAVELCDAIIRILDTLAFMGVDVEKILETKHEYNKRRDYRHGGKSV